MAEQSVEFMQAIAYGKIDKVKELIAAGASVNEASVPSLFGPRHCGQASCASTLPRSGFTGCAGRHAINRKPMSSMWIPSGQLVQPRIPISLEQAQSETGSGAITAARYLASKHASASIKASTGQYS